MAGLLASLFLLPLAGPVVAGDVYRWVDNRGNTHYSEVPPEQYKSRARRLDTGAEPTAEQRREAQERAARDRETARRLDEERERMARAKPVAAAKPPAQASDPNETPCQREWRAFAESNNCFAPYMAANGVVRPEAYSKCVEVKMPRCGPPPPHPPRDR